MTKPAPRRVPAADLPESLPRRLFAEFLGTALLLAVVIGSGAAAQQLSPTDVGLQLLENALATGFALTTLIWMFGPISGAHFNPWVSMADWFLGRRAGAGLSGRDVGAYAVAQVAGSIAGAVLANAMFGVGQHLSVKHRASGPHFISEVVATAVLIVLIFTLARTQRGTLAAPAVGAAVAAGYFWTSSTFFSNLAAVTGRMFTNTFAGIAPSSALSFIGAQFAGLIIAVVVVLVLYPDIAESADDVVVPHAHTGHQPTGRPTYSQKA